MRISDCSSDVCSSDLLTINAEFSVSIAIVRCQETPAGSRRWHVRFDTGLSPDITIAVRMNEENRAPLDYFLLPRLDMTLPRIQIGRASCRERVCRYV